MRDNLPFAIDDRSATLMLLNQVFIVDFNDKRNHLPRGAIEIVMGTIAHELKLLGINCDQMPFLYMPPNRIPKSGSMSIKWANLWTY